MRVLADTNIFIKLCRRLPLPAKVERVLSHADTVIKKLTGFPHRYYP